MWHITREHSAMVLVNGYGRRGISMISLSLCFLVELRLAAPGVGGWWSKLFWRRSVEMHIRPNKATFTKFFRISSSSRSDCALYSFVAQQGLNVMFDHLNLVHGQHTVLCFPYITKPHTPAHNVHHDIPSHPLTRYSLLLPPISHRCSSSMA